MDTEKRMREILTATGLYSGEDPFFRAELAAYGAGLRILFEAIEDCRRDLFVQTADTEMLGRFERLFRIVPAETDPELRRAMLLERGSVTPADHTRAALERQLLAAGIRGNIVEGHLDGLYVNVQELLGVSAEAAAKEAKDFLPAHLPCVLDFGVNTWALIDGREISFDTMDAAGYNWNVADAM